MSITKYLKSKYGFANNAEVPAQFLCEELLLEEKEVLTLLKRLLPRGHWQREMMQFSVFCIVVDEVLHQI